MKTSQRLTWFLFGLFFLLSESLLIGQMPQAFKYQTVVRNSSGNTIANQSVAFRLSILAGSAQGMSVYVETQTQQTSPMGIISLNVGEGTVVSGVFSQINWSSGNFYLQVELDPAGGTAYSLLGASKLLSVPYALYAQSSGGVQWSGDSHSIYYNGTVGVRGAIDTIGQGSDTILFEVKANNGEPIFQVLESGVRVNVEQGYGKGAKGGFIVGGRNGAKGKYPDLMRITNDSIRLYIDVSGKGAKGGFAVGGRTPGKKGGAPINFMHITPENTFIGQEAGLNDSVGVNNIFIGNSSGYYTTTGEENIFLGNTSGYNNIDGYYNVFVGRASGYSNSNGYSNIFIGDGSGGSNTEGQSNVYVGDYSGHANILGTQNVYLGAYAGSSATGDTNIFVGYYAGYSNGSGNNNVFIGSESGRNNISGRDNIFIGTNTGLVNESGFENIFIGNEAGTSNSTGTYNNVLGKGAGKNITTGNLNNILGDEAGRETTTGSGNVFLGDWAGRDNMDGNGNVYVGENAGIYSNGSNNVFLGFEAGAYETGSDKLYIANSPADSSHALIYGDFNNKTLTVNANMGINSQGFPGYGLVVAVPANQTVAAALYLYGSGYAYQGSWQTSSDRRLKENIFSLNSTLEKALSLRPVTFDWKDPQAAKSQGKQIGFIAQEVEELFPELVKTDEKGLKSMDYSKLSVIIIQAMKEQQLIIDKQQSSIQTLSDENKELKLQLQKINAIQFELDKIKASLSKP